MVKNMSIKLIGIDLDGTMLNDNKEISTINIEAIKNALSLGVRVVLATGRPLNDIVVNYHKQLGLFNPGQEFVGYNGSALIDVCTNTYIEKHMMNLDNVKEVFSFASSMNAACYAYLSDVLLYNHLNEYVLKERYFNNSNFDQIDLDNLPNDFECFKVMIAEEKSVLDVIEKSIPDYLKEKYTILRSMDIYLEFIPKDANKFNALRNVAKRHGIKDDEIMAIGDSMNDYPFKDAKYSVAMANSVSKIKNEFKYHTASNNDSGVGLIINDFIKKGEMM